MQGKDTSKIAGLSCRSGRVVLAGDRNYNPVPITMILKEHEDDIRGVPFCSCSSRLQLLLQMQHVGHFAAVAMAPVQLLTPTSQKRQCSTSVVKLAQGRYRQASLLAAGKIWTARIAAATPEQQVAWHTMHVIIDIHGIIFKARSDPALFGVKTEELMGQSVAFCIDYFCAIIEKGGNMADGIRTFLKDAKDSRQQVWRIGVCAKGRRTIPGLMKVCLH